MPRSIAPSAADIAFILSAPIFAIGGAVRLTQSDGDLAAHIRMGNEILANHAIPARSLASYTASTDPLIAPAWLSEVLYALLYRIGGLPLIAVVTGLTVAITHALVAQFLRKKGVDARVALIAASVSLVLGASHWLARPHMFSIAAAAITVFLLESRARFRTVWFFVVFALWVNLHGGWLFGLLLIGAYLVGDLLEARLADLNDWHRRARADGVALAAACLATLCNPYLLGLHQEVLGAVTSTSLAQNVDEYQPPDFTQLENLPFLLTVIAAAVLLFITRTRPWMPRLLVIAMTVFFGLRAGRNIALFGVTGIPLIALHVAQSWPANRRSFPYFIEFAHLDKRARAGLWSLPVVLLLLALGLNRGRVGDVSLIEDGFDRSVFPVEAVARARSAGLEGRIFHPWTWGGYLMNAWPGSSLHVDPLEFSDVTMTSHTTIESMQTGWRDEIKRWNIGLAILETDSPLAPALSREPGWSVWYTDSTAIVLRRASASAQPGAQ